MAQEVRASGSQKVAGSIPPWACRRVLEQDTLLPIAPDELVGTLHSSQCEWVNEKHQLYSTLDKGAI